MQHDSIKGITIAILFLPTLFAGLLPLKIRGSHKSAREQFICYCNCFAGGVFLGTCLLDLLPLIREQYQQAFTLAGIQTDFPVAEFTTCIGFFLILTIEQIVHTFHHSSLLHQMHGGHGERQRLLDQTRAQEHAGDCEQESSLTAYILILALSIHCLLEGIALGTITDADRLAQIAGAIMIHKLIMAFSLSVILVEHDMKTKTICISAFLFSVIGPVGIAIGMAVLHQSSELSGSAVHAILQGMANGTFLYVTFFEILQRELEGNGNRLLKVLAMVVGYSIVTVLVNFA